MAALPKSEILFLYESTYSIPNGDPFTGEQRYDDETKKILVSDVRIKRFVRDHVAETDPDTIFVLHDINAARSAKSSVKAASADDTVGGKKVAESGAAARAGVLAPEGMTLERFTELFDVRLFGGIVTAKNGAINLTGPVQFALLNPSLNRVDLRMHQNTSVFASSTEKTRGAIGTTTVVPYAVLQIHGWINPYSATKTNLTEEDIIRMFGAMWNGVNNANTRTKSNQNSLALVQIIYKESTDKVYGADRLFTLAPTAGKREEQIRCQDDYTLNLTGFEQRILSAPQVKEVRFRTEPGHIDDAFVALQLKHPKLNKITV